MGGAKNCPETPRQKMIGMMYLVLTAMLALNVSTDILNGFTMVDNSLHTTIKASDERNSASYSKFDDMFAQNPDKTKEWLDKANELRKQSDELCAYIQDFKEQIVILADGKEEVEARKAADPDGDGTREIKGNSNLDVGGQYALVMPMDALEGQKNGNILQNKIKEYREYLINLTRDTVKDEEGKVIAIKVDSAKEVEFNGTFATEAMWNAHEGRMVDWCVGVFDGMPVAASITILTKIQNDIRTAEGEMIQFLMNKTDAGDFRVNSLEALVIPESKYVIRGGHYHAQIVLSAIDSTKKPEIYIGSQLLENGIYDVVCSATGSKEYAGRLVLPQPDGTKKEIPFKSDYIVGDPSVTISNTELNVMYTGYQNKFSVSVPGIASQNLVITAPGASVTKSGALWLIKPSDSSKEVTINVAAKMGGKTQSMGSQKYRVKPLPKPSAYLVSGSTSYSEGDIKKKDLNASSVIEASYGPDGILNIPFTITSFKMYARGKLIESKGGKLSSDMLGAIGKMKAGDLVNLMGIKAKGPDGKEVPLSSITLILK